MSIPTYWSPSLAASLPAEPIGHLLSRLNRPARTGILLVSASRTAATFATLESGNAQNLWLFGRISVASGTGGLALALQMGNGILSSPVYTFAPQLFTFATSYWSCMFGQSQNRAGASGHGEFCPAIIGRTVNAGALHFDATPYTYEIGYALF